MNVLRNLRSDFCLEELRPNSEESVNYIHLPYAYGGHLLFGKSSIVIFLTEFSKELKILHCGTMYMTICTALLPCGPWINVSWGNPAPKSSAHCFS